MVPNVCVLGIIRVRTKLLSHSSSDLGGDDVLVVKSVDRYRARLEHLEGSEETRELTQKEYLLHVETVSNQ